MSSLGPGDPPTALAAVERCLVGVVAERRPGQGPWSGWQWQPIAAIAGGADLSPGDTVREAGDTTHVFLGVAEVVFVAAETEAYRLNLESGSPSLYVIATAIEDERMGLRLRTITPSPWEAEAYLDGMHVVERVPMPPAIEQLARDYVAAFHVETVFLKRQRKRHDPRKGFGRGSEANDYGPGTFEPTR